MYHIMTEGSTHALWSAFEGAGKRPHMRNWSRIKHSYKKHRAHARGKTGGYIAAISHAACRYQSLKDSAYDQNRVKNLVINIGIATSAHLVNFSLEGKCLRLGHCVQLYDALLIL
jgi:hypothetical protein